MVVRQRRGDSACSGRSVKMLLALITNDTPSQQIEEANKIRPPEADLRETDTGASQSSRQNPSGRNRTSDQLISENTARSQYTTLQSIALPTELHSVISVLPQLSTTICYARFDTHNYASYVAQHVIADMPRV